jgi:plastocyanin
MTSADRGQYAKRHTAWILAVCVASPAAAGTLRVKVIDERGEPVERVAVYAVPSKPGAATPATPAASGTHDATMDQAHNAFVPQVLIVQAGTSVLFPNNDVVSHHVYSFSEAKTFELGLYKGNAHPPLLFERPGLVVLGCNIHDSMLGYILVVDTPYYALSDRGGALALDSLPAGDYTLHVWTARLKPGDLPAEETFTVTASGEQSKVLKLSGKLLPDHDQRSTSLTWERY